MRTVSESRVDAIGMVPTRSVSVLHRRAECKKFHPRVLRHHLAKQRVGIGIVDDYRQSVADLPRVAVENDDAVAMRASGELERGAGGRERGVRMIVVGMAFGGFAGAFDENFDLAAEEGVVVLLADFVL